MSPQMIHNFNVNPRMNFKLNSQRQPKDEIQLQLDPLVAAETIPRYFQVLLTQMGAALKGLTFIFD